MDAERVQQCVFACPVVLAAHRFDPGPVESGANDVDAEAVKGRDALLHGAGAELEPGVVLDSEAE